MSVTSYRARDSLEEPTMSLPIRTRSNALDVEHKEAGYKDRLQVPSASGEQIDTPQARTPTSGRSQEATGQPSTTSRPPTAASSTSSRPPTAIEGNPPEPRLWVTDGPTAGKEASTWRRKFAQYFHNAYGDHTIVQRARIFDRLMERDGERYVGPIAAYYGAYPEHLPDRLKEEVGEVPEGFVARKQRRTFKGWEWDADAPAVEVEEELGPKEERYPGEEVGECEHCVKKKSKKGKMKQALRPVVEPVAGPVRTVRRMVSMRLGNKSKPDQVPSLSPLANGSIDEEGPSQRREAIRPSD